MTSSETAPSLVHDWDALQVGVLEQAVGHTHFMQGREDAGSPMADQCLLLQLMLRQLLADLLSPAGSAHGHAKASAFWLSLT